MTMHISLDDNETRIEPIKLARNIVDMVNEERLTHKDVKELIAYLSVYTRYNQA